MNIDKIAEAICDANFMQPTWHLLTEAEHRIYRRMAEAAVAAMDLTEFTCGNERWWSTPMESIS